MASEDDKFDLLPGEIISIFGCFAGGQDIEKSICMNVVNQTISWRIIGCGKVTEKKSGPAFNKVGNSGLVVVMRRDAAKAENYAQHHGVPKWYDDTNKLINDPEINAIYIATPPAFHKEYVKKALIVGKYVYVEKPIMRKLVIRFLSREI